MSRRDDEPMNTPDDEMFGAEWDADGHVSEDTVHAWLDRQLGDSDANAVESHVASCVDCAELVAEARGLKAATTRIVGSLDVVAGGIVPREDVARTASHIVALANAAERSERAKTVVVKKFWQNPVVLRAAAAVVVMVGATTIVMRKYSPTAVSSVASVDSSVATPVVANTSPVPTAGAIRSATAAPNESAGAPELNKVRAIVADSRARQAPRRAEPVDSTDAPVPFNRAESEKKLKETLAKSSSARTNNEQRAFVAKADSGVAKKMADAVGRGAVVNAGSAAGVGSRPGTAGLVVAADASLPVARPAVVAPPPAVPPAAVITTSQSAAQATPVPQPTKALADVATAADKSRADSASTATTARSFAGGGRGGGRGGGGGGRSAAGLGSLTAQKASDTSVSAGTPITVVGTVHDSATGKGLANVSVVVPGTTIGALTSNSGEFVLKNVPRTATTVQSRRIGYRSAQTSVVLASGDTARVSVVIKSNPAFLDEKMTIGSISSPTPTRAFATPLVASCALRTSPPPTIKPLFRAILGNIEGIGTHQVTIIGWPAAGDTTSASITRQPADNLSARIVSNGAQLDLRLTRTDTIWNGTAEEHRGNSIRAEPISLVADRASVCAK